MNRQEEATGGESTAELRDDIEQTREDMGATLEAIQDRLSPETLKDQAKDVVQEAAEQAKEVVQQAVREAGEQAREVVREATTQAKEAVHDATIGKAEEAVSGATRTARGLGTTMLEVIKQNPVPAALAGIGLGWLFMKSRGTAAAAQGTGFSTRVPESGRIGYAGAAHGPLGYAPSDQVVANADANGGRGITNTVGDAAGQTLEKAGGAVGQVKGVTGEVVTQAQEAAGRVAGAVQERTGRVAGGTGDQVQRLLEESPLVLGGIALATGAAVGLLLPTTQQEDQLLGQARDGLLQQAKETAQDVQPKVQRVVEEAQRAVQEEAKEQQLTSG